MSVVNVCSKCVGRVRKKKRMERSVLANLPPPLLDILGHESGGCFDFFIYLHRRLTAVDAVRRLRLREGCQGDSG